MIKQPDDADEALDARVEAAGLRAGGIRLSLISDKNLETLKLLLALCK